MNMATEMPFGKYQGTPISDLPDGYLEWLYGLDNLKTRLQEAVNFEYSRRFILPHISPLNPSGIDLVNQIIDIGYRSLAKELHPDHGGDADAMKSLNAAIAWLRRQAEDLE